MANPKIVTYAAANRALNKHPKPGQARRDILLDVSRLVWRWWRGGLPTGIDRVCLAYVLHFGNRSRAAVRRRGHHFILDADRSDQLFHLFHRNPKGFRSAFAALAVGALLSGSRQPPQPGQLYLNVGHTGLDEPSLPLWIKQNRLRAVYFIHDLIPLSHPQYCRPGEADKHAHRIENVLSSAAGVIGNSQATLVDLTTFAAERRLPMPPAVVSFIAGPPAPTNLERTLLKRPHFVTVGTIEGRKNHIMLLRIWERLARRFGPQTPILIMVGQRGWKATDALAMLDHPDCLKEHVWEFSTCGDDELANAIAGARALLMPSFAEGFGLPVAEALQFGTPVIASDLPVFREFAGDIPTYLDPSEEIAWERAIVDFAGESVERQRQCEAMTSFKAPDWQSHFLTINAWLDTLPEAR